MKETRISLLLLLSMSLLLLAFIVLFIWGFAYYRKAVNASPAAMVVNDSAAIVNRTRDSMQRIFTATINKLNAALDSTRINTDSVQVNMETRLKEFYSLKNEIDSLYETSLTPAQVAQARGKIGELQQKLADWRSKYTIVTEENKRLSALLAQMNQGTKMADQAGNSKIEREPPSRPVARLVNNGSVLSVTDLQLKAIMEDRQQETLQALQTDQLQGSFIIKGNGSTVEYDEIYVVLQQPDGRVLKQSAWDSGSFETRDGRKVYSYKLRFDYQQGENKRLHFFIEADRYQKGTYTMQVYHKGILLARTTKSLS